MNQPSKPPSPKGRAARGAETPDDLSIPILTERVTVPPRPPKPVPPLNLDIELPAIAATPPTGAVPSPAPTTLAPAPAPAPAPTPAPAPATIPPAPPTITPTPAPMPTQAASASFLAPSEIPLPTGGAWGAGVEIELREAILSDLAQRLPQEVEAIVRRYMNGSINVLVERLAADTRVAVAASLREIVDHAVKAELDRLRGSKR